MKGKGIHRGGYLYNDKGETKIIKRDLEIEKFKVLAKVIVVMEEV